MSRHTVESREFRINLYGRTISGVLAADDEGGLDNLTDLLLESGEVDSIEVRDPGATVWTVLEPTTDNEGTTE
jgi:hypothetical protein